MRNNQGSHEPDSTTWVKLKFHHSLCLSTGQGCAWVFSRSHGSQGTGGGVRLFKRTAYSIPKGTQKHSQQISPFTAKMLDSL